MNRKLLRIIATAVLLLAAWLVTHDSGLPVWQQLVVYLVPYLLIGYDVLGEAAEGVMEGDPFDEDFLMAIATIGALFIGFLPGAEPQFPEAVFVMLFFQVGELFEDYAEDRSRESIAKLMDIRPDTAHVERGGQLETVAPETVQPGDVIVVKPGEKVPLDGTVVEGSTSLDTVALTGESLPRDAAKGTEVASGCVSLTGVIKLRVTHTFGESTASRILQLVEDAGENKSHSETFIRRFARVYTPVVVFLALAIALIPPFFYTGYAAALPSWLYRALTFLVVSCPCALVISVPLTFFAGIGAASTKGILIKGGNFMEALSRMGIVVFDKTGTLTRGVFAVEAVHPDMPDERELLHLAAHVEHLSNHPIAAALRAAYPLEHDNCRTEQVEELPGLGIRAVIDGRTVCVGNEKMMAAVGAAVVPCDKCKAHTGTVVHVAVEGVYAGHVVIADQLKSDAADAVTTLKRLGVSKTVMLTGDREEVGRTVASQLGLDAYYAGLLPADKVTHVERLLKENAAGRSLAFVGDGINDAPVLARADVGVAMGALGSDAAIEAADVVLMDDKPSKLGLAIRISRRTIRIARQNAVFAIAVKVGILLAVASGFMGSWAMPVAVFGDVGVMVLAVLNAMRAMRIGGK